MTGTGKITHIIPRFQELETYVKIAGEHSLGFEYNDFFNPALLDDREALANRIAAYQKLGRSEGIDTLHGAFYDIVPFSWDSGISSHSIYRMQQSVEIAGELGCRGVVFHTGLTPGLVGDQKYRSHWLEVMADTVRMLLGQDDAVEIYCENMFDESPWELAELAAMLAGEKRFGICLDIGHMMLATGQPKQWFEAMGPYVRHFHVNDNHLNRDEHLALGCGKIDWPQIFGLIQEYGLSENSMLLEVSGPDRIGTSLDYLQACGL